MYNFRVELIGFRRIIPPLLPLLRILSVNKTMHRLAYNTRTRALVYLSLILHKT